MKNNKNKKMSGNMNADNIWIYKLEDCGCGIVIADNKEQAIDKVINAYLNHYSEFDPEYAVIHVEKAADNQNMFLDCPDVIEVSDN